VIKLEIPLGSTWTPGVRISKLRKVYWWGFVSRRGCVWVCLCPEIWGQISWKPGEIASRLLLGAYRKVARSSRMVTSPTTSRDPMTS